MATLQPHALCLQIADLYLAEELAPVATADSPAVVTPLLEEAQVATYAGVYLFEEGDLLTINQEGNRLLAAVPWEPPVELTLLATDQFCAPKGRGVFTFERGSEGQITQVLYQIAGERWPAQQITPWVPSAAELAIYAGDYESVELGTVYTLVVLNDQLLIQHQRHSDITLTPIKIGQFHGNEWWATKLLFQQAADGTMAGFTLSAGRVNGLQFMKRGLA